MDFKTFKTHQGLVGIATMPGPSSAKPSTHEYDLPQVQSRGSSYQIEAALRWAVEQWDVNRAELLLQQGAAVDAPSWLGHTPLDIAAAQGCVAMVQLLVEYGATIDGHGLLPNGGRADRGGALHAACVLGHAAVAQVLLHAGADPLLRDGEGCTAAELAADFKLGDWRACVQAIEAITGPRAAPPPVEAPPEEEVLTAQQLEREEAVLAAQIRACENQLQLLDDPASIPKRQLPRTTGARRFRSSFHPHRPSPFEGTA